MRRLLPSHLALLFLLAVLPTAAHAAATRAEYVAQAEPICGMSNDKIERLNTRFRALRDKGEFGRAGKVLRRTGTTLSAAIVQVRAIPPPPGDGQTISSWLDSVQRIANNHLKMGAAEAHEKFKRVKRLQTANARIASEAHALVADWNFHACVGA